MNQKASAEIYHQETKYYETEMAKHQKQLSGSAQPSPFKSYHTEKKIDLVPYLPLRNNPFTEEPIEAITEEEGYPFGIGVISRLLYFTNGVTGILQYSNGQSLSLRAAPSAGGLYPTEIYIAVRGLSTLEDGIYNFQVKDHSLVPVWEGNFWSQFKNYCLGHEAIDPSNLLMIMTSVYERSTWRYHERAYRRILLDTGHVIGNLFAYGREEGFVPCPISSFIDRSMNRLFFLDDSKEGVLFVVALPQQSSDRFIETPSLASFNPRHQLTDPDRDDTFDNPLLLHLHRSSSIVLEGTPSTALEEDAGTPAFANPLYTAKKQVPLDGKPIDWGSSIGLTLLQRRSTRSFSGKAFSKEAVAAIMDYAYLSSTLGSFRMIDPSQLETYLIIQRVVGLEEGVYFYDPKNKALRLIYAGDFKNQCWHFCLGQELARDAAFLVVHAAHLKNAMAQYGNRAYRYLHLDAGYIGQRINLAAMRLGLGVSGIGGFYDDEVNALLGLSLDKIIVYITTLGQPYES